MVNGIVFPQCFIEEGSFLTQKTLKRRAPLGSFTDAWACVRVRAKGGHFEHRLR